MTMYNCDRSLRKETAEDERLEWWAGKSTACEVGEKQTTSWLFLKKKNYHQEATAEALLYINVKKKKRRELIKLKYRDDIGSMVTKWQGVIVGWKCRNVCSHKCNPGVAS